MASTDPRRGDVWLTTFGAARRGEPGKNRPAVVLSADSLVTGTDHDLFVVVPLSSSSGTNALRPIVSPGEGVDTASVAICRAIRAVARSRLLHSLGRLRPATLESVERAVAAVLELDRPNGA